MWSGNPSFSVCNGVYNSTYLGTGQGHKADMPSSVPSWQCSGCGEGGPTALPIYSSTNSQAIVLPGHCLRVFPGCTRILGEQVPAWSRWGGWCLGYAGPWGAGGQAWKEEGDHGSGWPASPEGQASAVPMLMGLPS